MYCVNNRLIIEFRVYIIRCDIGVNVYFGVGEKYSTKNMVVLGTYSKLQK